VTTVHPKRIIHDPYSTISSNDREDNLKNNRIIHPIFENIKIPNHLIYDDNIEYLPDHYVLAALLGSESLHKTIWTVFRESSIHSLFIPTLRNIFSLRGEDFGVVCYLCTELNSDYFNTETPLRKIMRSDMYNVKYFIFFNRPEIARVLDLKDYLRPLLVSDTWNIYERTEKIYYAQILPYYPSVIFTDFNTKDRKKDGIDSLNWMRIQEEWFRIGNFDQAMVYPNSILIDELETPENYSSIVLFDYKYNSQDKALSLIKKYIENDGHVILYPSRDPIYRKLTLINHPNIHLMNYLGFSDIDIEALLNKLNIYKKEVATEITIIDTQINNNEINIILDNNSNTILPIRISSTYFPLWKHIDGQPVMMTSPVFSLFFTNTSENIIEFKKNNYDLWGRNISLIFLIFLIILFLEKIIPIRKIYEKYNSTN